MTSGQRSPADDPRDGQAALGTSQHANPIADSDETRKTGKAPMGDRGLST